MQYKQIVAPTIIVTLLLVSCRATVAPPTRTAFDFYHQNRAINVSRLPDAESDADCESAGVFVGHYAAPVAAFLADNLRLSVAGAPVSVHVIDMTDSRYADAPAPRFRQTREGPMIIVEPYSDRGSAQTFPLKKGNSLVFCVQVTESRESIEIKLTKVGMIQRHGPR